jgi:hypothetical protein
MIRDCPCIGGSRTLPARMGKVQFSCPDHFVFRAGYSIWNLGTCLEARILGRRGNGYWAKLDRPMPSQPIKHLILTEEPSFPIGARVIVATGTGKEASATAVAQAAFDWCIASAERFA